MESVLARIGVSNTPDNKQYGWLTVSVAGIIGIGGIGYLLFKK
jgi:preprotein translocase subunit Sss1